MLQKENIKCCFVVAFFMKSALHALSISLSSSLWLCLSWAKRTTRRLSSLANVPQDIGKQEQEQRQKNEKKPNLKLPSGWKVKGISAADQSWDAFHKLSCFSFAFCCCCCCCLMTFAYSIHMLPTHSHTWSLAGIRKGRERLTNSYLSWCCNFCLFLLLHLLLC